MSDAAGLFTDRTHLTTHSYATGANLAARQSIYQYQEPPIDFVGWALDQIAWRGDERALDAGCGNGAYLRRLNDRGIRRVTGFDLSRGILRENLPLNIALVNGDVQALPFEDASFDVVLAMHMLYHVPDIERAARELRRILRPGGALLASANATDHLAAITETIDAALFSRGISSDRRSAVEQRFQLGRLFGRDNGAELLGSAFSQIEWRGVESELRVPTPTPLVDYLNSMRSVYEPTLPESMGWGNLAAAFEQHVGEQIAREGTFRVRTHAGVFVCA